MSQSSHVEGLVGQLDELIGEWAILKHPFYQKWSAGELNLDALRGYATQYYHHVAAFPGYLRALCARCEDPVVREALWQNLQDEEAGEPDHPELWLRFAEGIGSSRERVRTTQPLPGVQGLIDTFMEITSTGSAVEGLGALYAYESQIPEVARVKMQGLVTYYGIDERETLRYFGVHRDLDVEHAAAERELLGRQAANGSEPAAILRAGERALGALWEALTDIQAAYC